MGRVLIEAMDVAQEPFHAVAAVISRAIRERRLLRFRYSEHERIVEPHALGYRGGDLQLLALQVGGGSDRPSPQPQWKAFSLAKMITGVELGEHVPFHDGRDYPRSFDRIVSSL
jgi:hypothetical protein